MESPYNEFHQDDRCDCGGIMDCWRTKEYNGSEYYYYLQWICHDCDCVEDRSESVEEVEGRKIID